MPGAGGYRTLDAVAIGCMPRLMLLLPRVRSCQTKRWRAAAMPPHSNPHPSSTESEPIEGKDPLRQDKTLPSVKPGRKGRPPVTCGEGVLTLGTRFTQGSISENSYAVLAVCCRVLTWRAR